MIGDLDFFFLKRHGFLEPVGAFNDLVVFVLFFFELFDAVSGEPAIDENAAERAESAAEQRNERYKNFRFRFTTPPF